MTSFGYFHNTDSADVDTNSADALDSADSTDLADLADSTDSIDSLGFSVLFILRLKVLYLLLSYPLSYTWLKAESKISRKEILITRYLQQYGVLGDCVTVLTFSVYVHYYIYTLSYIHRTS